MMRNRSQGLFFSGFSHVLGGTEQAAFEGRPLGTKVSFSALRSGVCPLLGEFGYGRLLNGAGYACTYRLSFGDDGPGGR